MSKNAIKRSKNQAASLDGQRTLRLAGFVRRTLFDFVIEQGMQAFDELLQKEQQQLCGLV
jgi:hypothetical protein